MDIETLSGEMKQFYQMVMSAPVDKSWWKWIESFYRILGILTIYSLKPTKF
jgi:hypothetical protein